MADLRLPTEIREIIWRFLLPRDKTFRFVQQKQREDLLLSDDVTLPRAEQQPRSATVLLNLLTLSKHTFPEVAYTFGSANSFCFDIRDVDAIQALTRTTRSYIYHVHLVDRLSLNLTTINIKELISQFHGLRSVSVPVYPEPFAMVSFTTNAIQRAMSLSVVRDLVEQLEGGCYTQLFLDYSQPHFLAGRNADDLLTIRLLRHVRSMTYYNDYEQSRLWLDMFLAWIYSYPGKRTKLVNILARMGSTYRRNFLACVVETKHQNKQTKGFTITLSMPR